MQCTVVIPVGLSFLCLCMCGGCSDESAPVEPSAVATPAEPTGTGTLDQAASGEGRQDTSEVGGSAPDVPDVPNAPVQRPAAPAGAATPPPQRKPVQPAEASDNPADGRAGPIELPEHVQRTLKDARYADFRAMCRRYFEIREELRPLELALAVGNATESQVQAFYALEAKADVERRRLMDYIWQDGRTREDRAAMSMIMSIPPQ